MADRKDPLPVFHFTVEWKGARIGFTEISGLTAELQPIEYREGNSFEYNVTKLPGMAKFGNLTMKRGIISGDDDFNKWITTVKMNKIERRDVVINLLDEEHAPVMTWKIKNAWPVKMEGPGLKSTGNEIAIETLELAHEGLERIAS